MAARRVLLLHAYDAFNSGDSLLVSGAIELVTDAGHDLTGLTLVAMVPESFGQLAPGLAAVMPPVEKMPTTARARVQMVASAAETLVLTGRGRRRLRDLAEGSALVVGVGGAYLRATHFRDTVVTAAYHLPQLQAAARSTTPSVYLPQSIGPLKGPTGLRIRQALTAISSVMCRDDRSFHDLAGLRNVRRVPDVAVLAVGKAVEAGRPPRSPGGRVAIIARDLRKAPGLMPALRALKELLPDAVWAVQSRAVGQDDAVFYEKIGIATSGTAAAVLQRPDVSASVSIRLHGSLESIIQGVPSVHLGYERKAAGAYGDLGVTNWLHDARSFDPTLVAKQAADLAGRPDPFWAAVATRSPGLVESRNEIVEQLARPEGLG
jgi:polysaccharide pyruvyl transferase WcaK-like protein